jgi:NADPH:quinone reductase-like Zn-dependent oxidoreductase
MATHIAVHQDTALAVPKGMELSEAAAIPEVFLTAFDALAQGEVAAGQCVLIHAIGSGVGTAALQLVQRAGATAIGTSRTAHKLDRAGEQGLSHSILTVDGKFAKRVHEQSGGHGADIILDFLGAGYLAENLKALANQGRLVVVGLLSGVRGELNLGLLLAKRARIIGTVLRSRSLAEKIQLSSDFAASVLPGFDKGELTPVIDRVMPMAEIAAAHEYMESNQSYGKIVLSW